MSRTLLIASALTTLMNAGGAPSRQQIALPPLSPSISGQVVADAASGAPIRSATVTLSGSSLAQDRQTTTDDAGRFEFPGLPAGMFRLSASKPGYVTSAYGAKRPGQSGGVAIALDALDHPNVTLVLPRGAGVAGRIVGTSGLPAPGASVSLLRARDFSAERQALPVASATVDDRGQYRIAGLPPGDYIAVATARRDVMASVAPLGTSAARAMLFPPVYHPGTAEPAQAGTLTVGIGQERSDINFQLVAQPALRIAGHVVLPDGKPADGVQITATLVSVPSSVRSLVGPRMLRMEVDGGFSLSGCLPGRYALTARWTPRGDSTDAGERASAPPPIRSWWATADVVLGDQDVTSLVLTLQAGTTLSGQFVFASATQQPPSDFSGVRALLTRVAERVNTTASAPPSRASADGSFTIEGVAPGRYRLSGVVSGSAAPGRPWLLESATLGGHDVRDAAFEVTVGGAISGIVLTFTDTPTELTGKLQDTAGQPASRYFVLAFPADRSFWVPGSSRIRPPGQPGTDGRFTVIGLPPGEYYLVALDDFDAADLEDAVFLDAASRVGVRVVLSSGQKTVQDLRLAR